MGRTFESQKGYGDDLEIGLDNFEFKSAGKKYINQNYKRIGAILGVEGAGLGVIKKQANRENKLPDIHGEIGLEQINFYRAHYDFSPLTQDEYETVKAQNTSSEAIIDEKLGEDLNNSAAEVGKLAKIEGREYTGEPDIETNLNALELDILRGRAQKAINKYQSFHQSFPKESRTLEIKEQYRQLEKEAWDRVRELAYKLGGNISKEVPQLRNILDSHRDLEDSKDVKESLLELGNILVNEEGNITHIVDDENNKVELNRPRTFEEIFNQSRPVHILYHTNEEDKKIGYIIEGLNLNTPDWIKTTLIGNTIPIAEIKDETGQSTVPTTEAVAPQENNLGASSESSDILNPLRRIVGFYISSDNIGFSRYRLTEQLKSHGFTDEQVTQAIDSMDINWNQQAIKMAKIYLQSRPKDKENWSKKELIQQLMSEYEQCTQEQARFAVDNITDYEWKEDAEVDESEQSEEGETTPQDSLDGLRLAYARAEEAWNRKPGDENLEDVFIVARGAYNTELERVLKLQVAEGQADNISKMFKDEVMSLRDSRIEQSQELQGKWEKRLNPIKEKFVNFVIKNKKFISRLNLAAGVAGGALALTGVGIPLAGGLAVARRMVSATLLGVSTGEGIRSLGEDADINSFWGKIKFQAVIPKLVQESLDSSEDEFKKVSEDVLKERLGTLEAYYRLNGGVFTNDKQQQAYEKVLTELARRVQENVIDAENNKDTLQSDWQDQKPQELTDDDITNRVDKNLSKRNIIAKSIEKYINLEKANPDRYTSELLNTISDTRIAELDEFRRKRKIATGAGIAVGLLAGGAVRLSDEFNKPDSVELTDGSDSTTGGATPDTQGPGAGPGGAGAPETGGGVTKPNLETTPLTGTEVATEAAAEQAQELAQDVSSLDSGETIWGEITKQLGENSSQAQIQQAVENLLQSEVGQNSIYELAQGTEGGRTLLVQWGIDNANEMAELSKEQLYEISKYLAPEVSPIAGTEFTESLSEALGTTNLTETQLQEAIYSFATSEQGGADLYKQIISNEARAIFLSEFGVNNAADFANLRPDEVYKIAQTVGVDNLDKLPGFELNDIILSKFEDAPDMVELYKGTRPLDVVQRYIANELGDLPYDSNLGKQVLDTYVQTDAGKMWLYDAIVNNLDINNQNIQYFKEYLRFKGITSSEEFVNNFNWSEFSGNKNIPTSGFWNQIRLPNGGTRLQPLSTFLQPSKMIGIKDAVRQVLTR